MLILRKSLDRGTLQEGKLYSRHTFSFAGYFDKNHINWGTLRVINEDIVDAGGGFPMHPHEGYEIFSLVLDGKLSHKDSFGNKEVINADEAQWISAGSGMLHSEFNNGETPVHFLQIWIRSKKGSVVPEYGTKKLKDIDTKNRLGILASPNGAEGSLKINQNAHFYISDISTGEKIQYDAVEKRKVWIHLISGQLKISDEFLNTGDGLAVENENIKIEALENSRFILMDVPGLAE